MARNLEELKIWVSPLTNEIYAGYFGKSGKAASQINVTNQVMSAVAKRLDQETEEGAGMEYTYEAGTLTWKRRAKEV